jgi:hypothetical protein
VSLASRIEPALLRSARLRHLPGASAAAEADLWFGPLVRVRGEREIILYDDVARRLRAELSPVELTAARELVQSGHVHLPPLVRLEEELIWLATAPDQAGDAARMELRGVIKAMVASERPGLGRWALGFLARVAVQDRTPEMTLLERLAEAQVFGNWPDMLEEDGQGAVLSPEERALMAQALPRVAVGVRLFEAGVELREPPAKGSEQVWVPATNPLVLDVERIAAESGPARERVHLQRGEVRAVPGATRPLVLATLAGERFAVGSRVAAVNRYHESVRPFLAAVHADTEPGTRYGVVVGPGRSVMAGPVFEGVPHRMLTLRNQGQVFPVAEAIGIFPDPHAAESLLVVTAEPGRAHEWRPAPLDAPPPARGDRCVAWMHAAPPYPEGTWVSFLVGDPLPNGDFRLQHGTAVGAGSLSLTAGSAVLDAESARFLGVLRRYAVQGESLTPALVPASRIAEALGSLTASPPTEKGEAPAGQAFRIYISYSYKDEQFARDLHRHLKRLGVPAVALDVFLDVERLRDGGSWEADVHTALSESDLMIALISPSYLASDFARRELAAAESMGRRIVPVVLAPVGTAQNPLSTVAALPADGRSITEMEDPARALAEVAQEIAEVVRETVEERRGVGSRDANLPGFEAYALVIGISRYKDGSVFLGMEQDAQAFTNWLLAVEGAGVSPERLHFLVSASPADPTFHEIERVADELEAAAERSASQPPVRRRLYIYLSGAGVLDPSGDVCMLSSDSIPGRPKFIWSRRFGTRFAGLFDEVVTFVSFVEPHRRPSADTFPMQTRTESGDGRGRHLMFAAQAADVQGAAGREPSPFTRAVINGLSGAAADEEGAVTADALRHYLDASLARMVPSNSSRSVTVIGDIGDWILAHADPRRASGSAAIQFPAIYDGRVAVVLDQSGSEAARVTVGPDAWNLELRAGLYSVGVTGRGAQTFFEVGAGETARVDVDWNPRSLRVLVAGTGEPSLAEPVRLASEALGQALAEAGFRLVVGGWHGVDYVTAREYSERIQRAKVDPREMLTQVVTAGQQGFDSAEVVTTESDDASFDEPIRRAGAVIIIGGLGGTMETFHRATRHGKPVLPLAGTGGDAARAYEELAARLEPWHPDLRGLDHPVRSPEEADALAIGIIARLLDLDAAAGSAGEAPPGPAVP